MPKDFHFATSLANTMNWNMAVADFEFNKHLEPDGCLVLETDSKSIGLATCIGYGQVGWFGNLVVDEGYRQRGAGTQLVQHAISYLRTKGVTTVGLYAYPHLVDFYESIGFLGSTDFVVLKADEVAASNESNGNLKLFEEQELCSLTDFDGNCFGAKRKKLLEQILRNTANICYISDEDSEVTGFIAAKVYDKAAEVGPLLCQRNKAKTAVTLLKTLLKRLDGIEAYLYLPASETALLNVATNAGFIEKFRLKRMLLGPEVAKNCIYSAESLERG